MQVKLVNSEEELIAACAGCELVGFHGTSSLACEKIDTHGFLPDKVFPKADHDQIIKIAESLEADTSCYLQWLDMQSVSFAQHAQFAINHVTSGHSGGQGLAHVEAALKLILDRGDEYQKDFAGPLLERIESIRQAPVVIYAVDLSGFGARLAHNQERAIFHYHLDPNAPFPKTSDIGPARVIARLLLT
ncbi:hypothetical protein [Burkholderia aenigmatica]|uniref:Uncharacterized protein n=1 Tax=Burkholderia aenigmatica TaxID=2015348 RepID=A0A228HHK8_9BURK|nr:hypothetical protein [Burkholderia aenigmatica]OXI29548.1 hypothetical protein CFB84_43905 [Burkholderia aenigmatica]